MRIAVAMILGIILIDSGLQGNFGSIIAAVISPQSLKINK